MSDSRGTIQEEFERAYRAGREGRTYGGPRGEVRDEYRKALAEAYGMGAEDRRAADAEDRDSGRSGSGGSGRRHSRSHVGRILHATGSWMGLAIAALGLIALYLFLGHAGGLSKVLNGLNKALVSFIDPSRPAIP